MIEEPEHIKRKQARCLAALFPSPKVKWEVSEAEIEALRSEAAAAGDLVQVEICDHALSGDEDARQECGLAIYRNVQTSDESC